MMPHSSLNDHESLGELSESGASDK
jgi:hypothetical protein